MALIDPTLRTSLPRNPRRGASVSGTVSRLGRGVAALARAATTPLVPSDYLDLVAPLRFGSESWGRIESRRAETPRSATLVIRPGHRWAGHRPGQYVRLGVDVDGVRHWRTYSLTSSPNSSDGLLAITVTAVDAGIVSTHLVEHARPGALVALGEAEGDFVLDRPPPERTLFVTAGSGITPVMGLLRGHPELRDVVLVHSARRADDVVFGAELRDLARAGRLTLVERHTAREGRLDLARLDDVVPDWRDRAAWVCGPSGLLDAAQSHWEQAGLAHALRVERFRPVVAAVGEGGLVTFSRSGVEVDADGSAPLLDSGEEAGVLMPSGCRMGICFGCVAPLRDGAVRDLRTGEVTAAAPGDSINVQTCVSAPAGPCTIDL